MSFNYHEIRQAAVSDAAERRFQQDLAYNRDVVYRWAGSGKSKSLYGGGNPERMAEELRRGGLDDARPSNSMVVATVW